MGERSGPNSPTSAACELDTVGHDAFVVPGMWSA